MPYITYLEGASCSFASAARGAPRNSLGRIDPDSAGSASGLRKPDRITRGSLPPWWVQKFGPVAARFPGWVKLSDITQARR